jgi:hypothetical protein
MIQSAEKILGKIFHITQGSYSTSVAASGSTHAGGGVFDATSPVSVAAQSALRRAGFAAWIRSPSQGPWPYHIHAVALGDKTASAAAKAQMASYRAGGIGLAQGGIIPSYPRLSSGAIIKASRYGTTLVAGEGGRDEAVLPLPRNWKNSASRSNTTEATTININGNLEFPNITDGNDADTFIKNLEILARN